MKQFSFTTTGSWNLAEGFGCASLGLPGVCANDEARVVTDSRQLEAVELTGTYEQILSAVQQERKPVQAAVILFGNVGGENEFLAKLQQYLSCPIVGGGAAIDFATNSKGLITGGGEAADQIIHRVFLSHFQGKGCIHQYLLRHSALAHGLPAEDLQRCCAPGKIEKLPQTLLFPGSGNHGGIIQGQFPSRQHGCRDAKKALQFLLKSSGSHIILTQQHHGTV